MTPGFSMCFSRWHAQGGRRVGLDGFDARDDYDHRVGGHGHPEVMMIISGMMIIVREMIF